MAAKTATIAQSWSSGDAQIATSKAYTSGKKVGISEAVADSVTDQEHALVLDVDQIKALIIRCDQDMEVEFNDGTTGVPAISMKKDVPYIWTTDSYDDLILSTDVTKVFVTNASGSAGTFELEAIVDPTV